MTAEKFVDQSLETFSSRASIIESILVPHFFNSSSKIKLFSYPLHKSARLRKSFLSISNCLSKLYPQSRFDWVGSKDIFSFSTALNSLILSLKLSTTIFFLFYLFPISVLTIFCVFCCHFQPPVFSIKFL